MTTKVTIDAHAGWPVEVTTIDTLADGKTSEYVEIVTPHTTRDFYIHQTRSVRVRELEAGS